VAATLFVIPGSHPSLTARLMLERKGIDYRRVDLVSAVHKPVLRALGFPGVTVPALRIDGRRVQGSRAIARALDELRPEPPLFPADPARRRVVEEAERFGDEELQPVPRRLSWWILKQDRSTIRSFLEGARLGLPTGVAARTSAPVIAVAARLNQATDESVRQDLAALPAMLDRVDGLIADGVIGGEEPNAADYQIATSVRLLLCSDDLRPELERRPAGEHARRIVPSFPGRLPGVLPSAWLEPLLAPAGAPA
jgi:glutathione S-transferase